MEKNRKTKKNEGAESKGNKEGQHWSVESILLLFSDKLRQERERKEEKEEPMTRSWRTELSFI